MRPALRPALAAVLLGLALPASAAAQSGQAPPGNSAVDEYLETVPGSGGSSSAGGNGVAPKLSPGAGRVIPKATLKELSSQGDDGRAAAALAEATSPAATKGVAAVPTTSTAPPGLAGPQATSATAALPDASGGSRLAAISRALTSDRGEGGLGLILPIGMLFVLTAALGSVAIRRRGA